MTVTGEQLAELEHQLWEAPGIELRELALLRTIYRLEGTSQTVNELHRAVGKLSRATVVRCLRALSSRGLVNCTARGSSAGFWTVNLSALRAQIEHANRYQNEHTTGLRAQNGDAKRARKRRNDQKIYLDLKKERDTAFAIAYAVVQEVGIRNVEDVQRIARERIQQQNLVISDSMIELTATVACRSNRQRRPNPTSPRTQSSYQACAKCLSEGLTAFQCNSFGHNEPDLQAVANG